MAVVIDPGRGALAESIGNLGQGLAQRVFRRQRRERELIGNPEQLQAYLPAFRAAKAEGPEAVMAFENAIGVREGFAEEYLVPAVVPTSAQLQEEAIRQTDLPTKLVDLAVLNADFETQTVEEALGAQLPLFEALGRREEIEAAVAQNRFEGSYFERLFDEGGVQTKVKTDLATMQREAARAGIELGAMQTYSEAINSLDQSTPEGRRAAQMAATFISNPGFANYLAQQEEMDFRARLAQFQANPTFDEKTRLTTHFLSEQQSAIDRLQELEDEDDADDDVLEAQRTLVDNYANINQQLQRAGAIFENDLVRAQPELGFFGGEKGNEFITQNVKSQQVKNLVDTLAAIERGEITPEDERFITIEDIEANKGELFTRDDVLAEWDAVVAEAQRVEAEEAETARAAQPTEDEEGRPTQGPTLDALSFTRKGREDYITALQSGLRKTIIDTEMDPEVKAEKIKRTRDLIKAFQNQMSIAEWLGSIRQENVSTPRGSLRVPGRNDGNE